MIVRYHSNQKTTDLFIAENVSKIINQHQEVVVAMVEDQVVAMVEDQVVAMVEDQVAAMVEDQVAAMVEDQVAAMVEDQVATVEEMTDHEKCLTQNVLTVEMIVRYHSNQKTTDLFIAENVSKITDKITKLF